MILLLDNYDSFTYNLYDYLLQLGETCRVIRNDECRADELLALDFEGIVLSPGPCRPKDAGILMEVVQLFHDKKPLLGICLGHQAIGEFYGANLVHASMPMHGKTSKIEHTGTGIFEGLPQPMEVMRYHSLLLEGIEDTPLQVTASTSTGEVMAFQHSTLPISGVQFHPESILTPNGLALMQNWLASLPI